jgi:AraC-like DNA-binding protein
MPGSTITNYVDPHEYQKAVQSADLQVYATGRGKFEANLTRIKLDQLWLQRARLSLPAVTHSVVAKDRRMIFLQFDPDQAPILHSGIEVPPNEIVCYPLGSEHHYRTSTSYHCGGMSLMQEDFAALANVLVGYELTAPTTMQVVRPRPALMSRLLNLHKAAADLAATAPDILVHPEVAKAMEQEFVRAMIACLTDPATEERYRARRQRLMIMPRFEQMLEARQDESLYVTDVCTDLGVSERTLRLHCQEQLGMSPHRYLWIRRMNLAFRALTLADATTKTVTEIANDYGFGELGRFAVAYRKLFGESPSATLRREPNDLRDAGGPCLMENRYLTCSR